MVLWLGRGGAHGLLAELLKSEYGLSPPPPVERDENGKPFFPGHRGLYFNLSHSGGLALCGAGAAPLGVDLEILRPRREGLARYALSEAEYAFFRRQGGAMQKRPPRPPKDAAILQTDPAAEISRQARRRPARYAGSLLAPAL